MSIPRVVHVGCAPSLERFDLGRDGLLVSLRTAHARRFFAVQQVAAGPRQRKLARALIRDSGQQSVHERVVGGGGLDVRAALEQRQSTAPDKVDLEAEEVVVRLRLSDHGLDFVANAEQTCEEAADVRRHRHDQVRSRDRAERGGHLPMRRPLGPQFGLEASHVVAKQLVQRLEASGLVQVGERKAGDAQRIMRAHWRTHEFLKVLPAVTTSQTIVQIPGGADRAAG